MDLKNGRDILKKTKVLDIFNTYYKSFMKIKIESSLESYVREGFRP